MTRPQVPTTRQLMTTRLVTLRPTMHAVDAAALLLKNRISGAPVVDPQGGIIGLLSEFDCLRAVAAAEYEMDSVDEIQTVADLMSREFITIGPEVDLFGLATEFVRHRVRRFPVVENGRLLGQVSRRDALRGAVELRRSVQKSRHRHSVYPEGREPIRDYPR
jgi:CBS domain-containing protein